MAVAAIVVVVVVVVAVVVQLLVWLLSWNLTDWSLKCKRYRDGPRPEMWSEALQRTDDLSA